MEFCDFLYMQESTRHTRAVTTSLQQNTDCLNVRGLLLLARPDSRHMRSRSSNCDVTSTVFCILYRPTFAQEARCRSNAKTSRPANRSLGKNELYDRRKRGLTNASLGEHAYTSHIAMVIPLLRFAARTLICYSERDEAGNLNDWIASRRDCALRKS